MSLIDRIIDVKNSCSISLLIFTFFFSINIKRGGVCLYYKTCLPLRVLDIQYLNKCINFELKICDKLCTFVALYRSPR